MYECKLICEYTYILNGKLQSGIEKKGQESTKKKKTSTHLTGENIFSGKGFLFFTTTGGTHNK